MIRVFLAALLLCISLQNLSAKEHVHNAQNVASMEILEAMHSPMHKELVESGNVDVDFLSNMIPHHLGAIDSAKKLLTLKDIDPKIQKIANNIITAQEQEIKDFNVLLSNKENLNKTPITKEQYQDFVKVAKENMNKMMQDMDMASKDNPQKTFIQAMIGHHLGAILASRQILTLTKDERIQKIANNIIIAQEQEIKEFQAFLK